MTTGSMHNVKSGESLAQIARRYNVSEEALREANDLDAGQALPSELKIPTREQREKAIGLTSGPIFEAMQRSAKEGAPKSAVNARDLTASQTVKSSDSVVSAGEVEAAFAMLVQKLSTDPAAKKETQELIKKYTGKDVTSSSDLVKSLAPVLAANPNAAREAVALVEKHTGASLPGGERIVQEKATEIAKQLQSAKALAEEPKRGENKNAIVGFAKGLWGGVSDLAKGVWDIGKGAVKLSGITGAENQKEAFNTLTTTVKTVVENPGAVWDAIKEPYAKAWEEGDYGYIAGRGLFDVVTTIGTGGIGGAGAKGVQVGSKMAVAAEKVAVVASKASLAEKAVVVAEKGAVVAQKAAVVEKAVVLAEKGAVVADDAVRVATKLDDAAKVGTKLDDAALVSTRVDDAAKIGGSKIDDAAKVTDDAAKAASAMDDAIRAAMKDPAQIEAIALAMEKAGGKGPAVSLLRNYAARLRSAASGADAGTLNEMATAGRMTERTIKNALGRGDDVSAAVKATLTPADDAARFAAGAERGSTAGRGANAADDATNAGARTSNAGRTSNASERASQAGARATRAAEEAAAAASSKLKRAAAWMGTTTMGKLTAATMFGVAGGPLLAPLGWYLASKLPKWMGLETKVGKAADAATDAARAAQAARAARMTSVSDDAVRVGNAASVTSRVTRAAAFVGIPAADRLAERSLRDAATIEAIVNGTAAGSGDASGEITGRGYSNREVVEALFARDPRAPEGDDELWANMSGDGVFDERLLLTSALALSGVDFDDPAFQAAFADALDVIDAHTLAAIMGQIDTVKGTPVDDAGFEAGIKKARGEPTSPEILAEAGVGKPEVTPEKVNYGIYTPGPSLADVRLGATLQRGHSGDGVKDAQRALNKLGAGLGVDGKMGPKTEAAVRDFQKRAGLPETGKVDASTLKALESAKPESTRLTSQPADRASFPAAKNSAQMSAMVTQALADAKAKGIAVPPEFEQWANSPHLMKILERESGGRVGVPNYTFGAAARDPSQWANIHARLQKGEVWTKSTATGLFQLTNPNAKRLYPDGLKGIGDPTNEVLGGLRYIKERYGTPERALAFHFAHNWY